MIVIVCVIVIGFIFNVISQDCGQLYFNGTFTTHPDGGIIRMPELLSSDLISLTDIPHTCTFILRNLNTKGQIKLLFDDFLMYGGNATSPTCDWPINQDQLEIYDGEHSKALPLFDSCFTRHKRPPALMSSGNTMRIEYQHWGRFPGYPAFKVHYYFVDEPIWRDKPNVETYTRFENGDSSLSRVLSVDLALDVVWLLVAPPTNHVFLRLETVQFHGVSWDPNISFQVHDGLTSDSQLVHKFSKISTFSTLSISSSKNALYLRWQSIPLNSGSLTVAGLYVFYTDIVDGKVEDCEGFACELTRRCIPSLYECDTIDHCGDNADENYCQACDENVYCFNGGVCVPKSAGDYQCKCQQGYSGKFCEKDESECPDTYCNNGGDCRLIPNTHDFSCHCRHGYTGTQCQIDNRCPDGYCQHGGTCYAFEDSKRCICHNAFRGSQCQYTNEDCLASFCQNGGTCKGTVHQYICQCPPGFEGMYCETTIDDLREDNLASTLQYSLVVVVPSFVLLGLIWIGYRAKKGYCTSRVRHRSRGSFGRDSFSDNPSSISRVVSRMNSTSTTSSYTDDPPPYHSVACIAPRSPRGRLLSRTSISLQPSVPEEPPPSYETVITSLENCQVRIIPQSNSGDTPRRQLEENEARAECSLSQTSVTSEDVVYSTGTGSVTSTNTSPARDPLLPDVVYSGDSRPCEATDMTCMSEQDTLLKDSYIKRATSL
ncbi:uncharacterized protein [Amphiura filiformis]|uniref:uncharacterized protein isoform X2 n=1 Tax=Amphiura filiformis TaxID=82378 RepID=UPI003B20E977